jgi:ABC-type transport system substrate-binding protein
MRRSIIAALLPVFLFTSCATPSTPDQVKPEPVFASTSIPTPTQITHAPEIRFALVGEPTDVNVWMMFDEQGASYANYAIRNDYWPRLYYLAPPELTFTPRAASGEPTPVIQEGDFFTSTVSLRSDLKWTDGSPFTAEDVAFTVNVVLHFELGLDWKDYYPPEYLARAEAVNSSTVKFFFKQKPNVGVWQYGVLQGPIVQRKFWEPKIEAVLQLLPDVSLPGTIDNALKRIAEYQPVVVSLSERVYILQSEGKQDRELEMELKRKQGDLDEAQNDLTKALAEYADKLETAHQALYALDDLNEPTLGVWLPAQKEGDKWIKVVNPALPFEKPNFDRVLYTVFEDINSAYRAYKDAEVDVSISPYGAGQELTAPSYPTSSARFLVFNQKRNELTDPVLHKAISCILETSAMLSGQEWAYDGFVLPGPWLKDESKSICSNLSREQKIQKSVSILKDAGYSWVQEPTVEQAGVGLKLPNGNPFPSVTLLTTSVYYDRWRANAGIYIEMQAQYMGIPLNRQETDLESIRYSVYSSGNYDLAILGWQLSEYPGYLCEWFQSPSPFAYNGDKFGSVCDAFNSTADLETARHASQEIQSVLMEDLPFIPLYLHMGFENYQNVTYPFETVLNGLSGLYGAPSLAVPAR